MLGVAQARSVKLLENEIKVVKKIFEKQHRKQVEIDEMQMGFMAGKDTINVK